MQIFFMDSKNQSIPVTVTQYKQRKMIRCYVKIDQNVNIGFGILIIVGKLQNYSNGKYIKGDWGGQYNIKFQKSIYVNPYQITPSVLRFKTVPTVDIKKNQDNTYKNELTTTTQNVPISSIKIPNKDLVAGKNMFQLQIEMDAFTDSVFYQKFLNYVPNTSSLYDVTGSYKQIFKGYTESEKVPAGKYKGAIEYGGKVPLTSSFCDITITNGEVYFNNPDTIVHKLEGKNIKIVKSTAPQLGWGPNKPTKQNKDKYYSVYAEGNDFNSLTNLTLMNGETLTPISFLSHIASAQNLSMQTNYFTGEIFSSQEIFSQEFSIITQSDIQQVYGYFENKLILDPYKKTPHVLSSDKSYKSYIFSGSSYTLSASKNTVINNLDVKNCSFLNENNKTPITFNTIHGQLFSKKIITMFSGRIDPSAALQKEEKFLIECLEVKYDIFEKEGNDFNGCFIHPHNDNGEDYKYLINSTSGVVFWSATPDEPYEESKYEIYTNDKGETFIIDPFSGQLLNPESGYLIIYQVNDKYLLSHPYTDDEYYRYMVLIETGQIFDELQNPVQDENNYPEPFDIDEGSKCLIDPTTNCPIDSRIGHLILEEHGVVVQEQHPHSYFSGSLVGSGTFLIQSSGSTYRSGNFTKQFEVNDQIKIGYNGIFSGSGYNLNVDAQYFSGSIYTGSLLNEDNIKHTKKYDNVLYNIYIIQAKYLDLQLNNLKNLQIQIPDTNYFPSNLQITTDDGDLFVSSEGDIYLSSLKYGDFPLMLQGNLNLKSNYDAGTKSEEPEKTEFNFKFNGVYQNNFIKTQFIQSYQIKDVYLTTPYQKIFNTSEIIFLNDDYQNLYVPIAIDINYNELPFLLNRLFDHTESIWSQSIFEGQTVSVLKQNISKYSLEMGYTIVNQTQLDIQATQRPIIPIEVVMSDLEIYSGYLGSYQMYYTNKRPYNSFQLLSIVEVDQNPPTIITKSIDIPLLGFSDETVNFKIKYKDGKGNYCPQQFFSFIYGVDLQVSELQQNYNLSSNINEMVGDVELSAQNIPYNLINVQIALDTLFGLTPPQFPWISGSVIDCIKLPDQITLLIGGSQSYNFTWNITKPQAYVNDMKIFVYQSVFPNEEIFDIVKVSQTSLDWPDNNFTIPNLSRSIKIYLRVEFESGRHIDYDTFIYFRNNIYVGTSPLQTLIEGFDLTLFTPYLKKSYQGIYDVNAGVGQYIYFAFPQRMTEAFPPQFAYGNFIGGVIEEQSINHTNDNGYLQLYSIYRSTNHSLGRTIINVTSPLNQS